MLQREGGDAVWGYAVHSVGLHRDVALNANADVALIPASNVKLMTCAAALIVSHVGPGYRFETCAHVEQGEGDEERVLCVNPSGDPTLRWQEVKKLVKRALVSSSPSSGAGAGAGGDGAAGKVRVKLVGKPWVDEGPHPTWEVGDLSEPWAAPPSRTVLDGNVFPAAASAAAAAAAHPQGPSSPRSHFIARVTQVANNIDNDEDEDGGDDEDENDDDGQTKRGSGETAAVSRHRSRSVTWIARRALEDSDNMCAEQLLRAASGGRDSGRWLTSWSAVYVNKHCSSSSSSSTPPGESSPTPRRVRLVDGSGLSRHNLAPPRAFVALLLEVLDGARREEEEEEQRKVGSATKFRAVIDAIVTLITLAR